MGVQYVNVEPAGPAITAINPNPIPTGSYTITLTGAGFKAGATVSSAGNNLPTTYVNATTLKTSGYQGRRGRCGVFRWRTPAASLGRYLQRSSRAHPGAAADYLACISLGDPGPDTAVHLIRRNKLDGDRGHYLLDGFVQGTGGHACLQRSHSDRNRPRRISQRKGHAAAHSSGKTISPTTVSLDLRQRSSLPLRTQPVGQRTMGR